jgi:nickel-type superoxide dismutase maturation protease
MQLRSLQPLARYTVQDTSMLPALRPGDRVLVGRWLSARIGDIVVFRDPEARATFTVKRVTSLAPNGDSVVHGDNPNVSRDSRHFGLVARSLIVGRAIYRYLPGDRRGRL